MKLLNKSINASIWQAISLIANLVTNSIVVGILARLLLPEAFGVIAIANTIINITSIIADVGVGQYIIKEPNVDNKCIRCVLSVALIIGFSYFTVLSLCAPLIAWIYKMPQLTSLIIIISFSVVIKKIGLISQNLLYKELRYREVAISDVISYLLGYGVVGIIMAKLGYGVYSLAVALAVKSLLHTIMTYMFSPHSLIPGRDKKMIKQIIKFGGGVLTMSVAGSVAYHSPALIMGKLLTDTLVGYYDRAITYAIYPVTAAGSIFDKVFYSAASKILSGEDGDAHVAKTYTKIITILTLPILIGTVILIAGAEDVILILLGENWLDVIPVFQILCVGIYFRIIVGFSDAVYKLKNALYKATVVRIIYALIVIVVTMLACLTKNLIVITVGINIAVIYNFLVSAKLVKKVLNVDYKYVFEKSMKYLFVSVVSGILLYFLRLVMKGVFYNCVFYVFADILVVVVLSVVLLRLIDKNEYMYVLNELKLVLNSVRRTK